MFSIFSQELLFRHLPCTTTPAQAASHAPVSTSFKQTFRLRRPVCSRLSESFPFADNFMTVPVTRVPNRSILPPPRTPRPFPMMQHLAGQQEEVYEKYKHERLIDNYRDYTNEKQELKNQIEEVKNEKIGLTAYLKSLDEKEQKLGDQLRAKEIRAREVWEQVKVLGEKSK